MELFGVGVARWRADVTLDDERIEVDHFCMIVQSVQHNFASDARRQRGNGGENGPFRHGSDGTDFTEMESRNLRIRAGSKAGGEDIMFIWARDLPTSCLLLTAWSAWLTSESRLAIWG